ncbi:MAG: molybdopterin-dependent oxidoreductase [Thermocladium sp.]
MIKTYMVNLSERRRFIKLMLGAGVIALIGSSGYRLSELIMPSEGSRSALTPLNQWYVVQIGPTPTIDVSNYRLMIDGLVQNPLALSLSEIMSMASTSLPDTIQCVSDSFFLKANVLWRGVPLRNILEKAKPMSNASKVILFGADGYTSDLPMEKAMEDTTLVVYEADNELLLNQHGYPVRLAVPGWWGYKYVKWLTRISLTDENYLGYWESRGYPDVARK